MNLRHYLLRLMTEAQQNEIEERYFTEDEFFETMLAAEDELVEAYINKQLSRRERKRFEECLLPNPRWQKKIATIRALQHVVNEKKAQCAPEKLGLVQRLAEGWQEFMASVLEEKAIIGLAYATVFVLLVLSGIWVGRQFQNFQYKIANLEAAQSRLVQQGEQLRQQLAQQIELADQYAEQFDQEKQQRLKLEQMMDKMRPQPAPMLAFALEPGILRDPESQHRLVIPSNVSSVRFDLMIEAENGYQYFWVVITTVEGNEIYSQRGLIAQKTAFGKLLNLNLPTIALHTDDYILTLNCITAEGKSEILHRYFFSVLRR